MNGMAVGEELVSYIKVVSQRLEANILYLAPADMIGPADTARRIVEKVNYAGISHQEMAKETSYAREIAEVFECMVAFTDVIIELRTERLVGFSRISEVMERTRTGFATIDECDLIFFQKENDDTLIDSLLAFTERRLGRTDGLIEIVGIFTALYTSVLRETGNDHLLVVQGGKKSHVR